MFLFYFVLFCQNEMSVDLQVHVLIAVCCKVKHHDFGMASFDRTVRNKKNMKACSVEKIFVIIIMRTVFYLKALAFGEEKTTTLYFVKTELTGI